MEKKVLDTIKKFNLIEEGDRIVMAVSGGPDSIAMLDILIKIRDKLNFTLCVAHVNHMIREEAEEDKKFVENYCKKNNIDFYSKSIDVQKLANNNKIGTEEAGRLVRYEFFDEVFVIGKIGNSFQQIEIGNPVVADFRRDKVRQRRIGMQQPTPRRNAVGHVGEFFRPQFIEFRNQ